MIYYSSCLADSEYFTFVNGKDPKEAMYVYFESYVMGLWYEIDLNEFGL